MGESNNNEKTTSLIVLTHNNCESMSDSEVLTHNNCESMSDIELTESGFNNQAFLA